MKLPIVMEMIIPPLMISTTSAPSMWDALLYHPFTARIQRAKERLLKASKVAIEIHETESIELEGYIVLQCLTRSFGMRV